LSGLLQLIHTLNEWLWGVLWGVQYMRGNSPHKKRAVVYAGKILRK